MFNERLTMGSSLGAKTAAFGELYNDIADMAMKLSAEGLEFIAGKQQEGGLHDTSYKDQAGLDTVGYGHKIQPGEKLGKVSQQQALNVYMSDIALAENAVNRNVKACLNQHQFDALVSLTFNIGPGAFAKSSVLSYVNAGKFNEAAEAFALYNKYTPKGSSRLVVSAGLTARRAREANLFLNGDY